MLGRTSVEAGQVVEDLREDALLRRVTGDCGGGGLLGHSLELLLRRGGLAAEHTTHKAKNAQTTVGHGYLCEEGMYAYCWRVLA